MSPILDSIGSVKSLGWGSFSVSSDFESIATATGTGSSSVITFSNIPSGYQHLQIRYRAKNASTEGTAAWDMEIQFNGNTDSNYANHTLRGNGAAASATGAATQTRITIPAAIPNSATALANMFAVGILDIHNYLSTSQNKTLRGFFGLETNRTTTPTGNVGLVSGLFHATPAAITSISLATSDGNWTTTTQFALYGIKGA